MEIAGEFEIGAPVERVWASLWDERTMPAWLPGCKAAHWDGDGRVHGEVEQSVAQLNATFAFDMRVIDKQPPERLRLSGSGRGRTIKSDVTVDMDVTLHPLDSGAARVTYVIKAELTGALAKVGNFVLKLKAKDLQQRMVEAVRSRLEGDGGPPAIEPTARPLA